MYVLYKILTAVSVARPHVSLSLCFGRRTAIGEFKTYFGFKWDVQFVSGSRTSRIPPKRIKPVSMHNRLLLSDFLTESFC
jgi:hypothetical protein